MSNILINSNNGFVIYNFRKEIIQTLIKNNHTVICSFSGNSYVEEIESLGCKVIILDHKFSSYNIAKDFGLIKKYSKLVEELNIDYMLNFTIKPNIFGTFVARKNNVFVINNITGLGRTFSGLISRNLMKFLYKASFRYSGHVFFQNQEDKEYFLKSRIIGINHSFDVINGSGVDINSFKTSKDISLVSKKIKVLFVGRILKEKGYYIYSDSAQVIMNEIPDKYSFSSIGKWDSRSKISSSYLEKSVVSYLGTTTDIKNVMDDYDIICLPSMYREGVPRSLIEALALSKIIVTTDSVGCKETVRDNLNGVLVEKSCVSSLVNAFKYISELDNAALIKMREESRKLALEKFDVSFIIDKYLNFIK